MHVKELQRYRWLLEAKRQELLTARTNKGSVIPAAGGFEADPVDQANADAEADLQIQLHRSDERLLRAVEEAIGRINNRIYGLCESCKKPIARARLEAVPWTPHCRRCK